jgi:hypothetical protein
MPQTFSTASVKDGADGQDSPPLNSRIDPRTAVIFEGFQPAS